MAKLQDPDIILNIIVRLPVKSILRFRCVSKTWCTLLKDPYFVKKHLNHAIEMNKFSVMMHPLYAFDIKTYSLAYDPSSSTLSNRVGIHYPSGTTFWGTCNGLVCLTTTFQNHIVLWNPATNEFMEVPTRPIQSVNEISYFKYGFGYDDKFDDFKVVSFVGVESEYVTEVQVYTLKSNSWKRLENIPYELYAGELDMAQVCVNGAMHWLALPDYDPYTVILSFDFKDDRFNEMPLPSFLDVYDVTNLCSLGGSLCLHGSITYGGIDVWEMKQYGMTESWVQLFTIKQTTICQFFTQLVPLQFVKNGKVLLGYDTDVDFHLDLYDLKHGTSINLKAHNANRDSYSATTFVYVESLVPLNSGTYVALPEVEESKASAITVDGGDSKDDDNSEEEEEDEDEEEEGEEEEITKGFPASPKSVNEARETSSQKSCEVLDTYKRKKLDLETRKLDLEAKKLDLEARKLDLKIHVQEKQHMSMDTSKMNDLQLKWWQMRANQIAENCCVSNMSIGVVNDDKEEDKDRNDKKQEENRKKKAKTIFQNGKKADEMVGAADLQDQ